MLPKKAFHHEEGQFICHIHAKINLEEQEQILDDVVAVVQGEQRKTKSQATDNWVPVVKDDQRYQDADEETKLHLTLIRGHRAVYYHQIKPLIEELRNVCEKLEPICICLDQVRLLENFERTKQFLCLVARNNDFSFDQLKQKLQDVVDLFAMKLTSEDETEDTLAHVSLMYRDVPQRDEQCDLKLTSGYLDRLLSANMDEQLICLIRIESISVKIGKCEYQLKLSK